MLNKEHCCLLLVVAIMARRNLGAFGPFAPSRLSAELLGKPRFLLLLLLLLFCCCRCCCAH